MSAFFRSHYLKLKLNKIIFCLIKDAEAKTTWDYDYKSVFVFEIMTN